MKYLFSLIFLLAASASGFSQTNFTAVMVDSNSAVQRPTNFLSINRILAFDTNGNVVYTNTNALTFTNRFRQSSDNATNPPEIRLVTKSNAVASFFYYDAFGVGGATNPINDKDWAIMWLGNNHVVSSSGQDFGRADFSKGAISLTMENMYYAGSLPSPQHVGEFYLNISDYTTNGSGTTRAIFVVGSQTNSSLGFASFAYPVKIAYNKNATDWLAQGDGGLVISTTNGFQLANFWNLSETNSGGEARIMLGSPNNAMAVSAGPSFGYVRQFSAGRTAFYIDTNGVIYGATDGNMRAAAPVHLAGDTRIDGAISFNNPTNAATTRTNLGLGGGITATNTFVSYNGTNYTTNTVTISNGIITGWTQ